MGADNTGSGSWADVQVWIRRCNLRHHCFWVAEFIRYCDFGGIFRSSAEIAPKTASPGDRCMAEFEAGLFPILKRVSELGIGRTEGASQGVRVRCRFGYPHSDVWTCRKRGVANEHDPAVAHCVACPVDNRLQKWTFRMTDESLELRR